MRQPMTGVQLSLALKLQGQADRVSLRIYTKALVLAEALEISGQWGPGWVQVNSVLSQRLPRGLYYLRVSAAQGGQGTPARLTRIYLLD